MNPFHYPPVGAPGISRTISTVVTQADQPLAAAQTETDGGDRVSLFTSDPDGTVHSAILSPGDGFHPQEPRLAAGSNGYVHAAWNACRDGHWRLCLGTWNDADERPGAIEAVRQGPATIFAPALADNGLTLCLAWAEETSGGIRIHTARRDAAGGVWSLPETVSPDGIDCRRPSIAALPDGWLLAWDCYVDGRHKVQVLLEQNGERSDLVTLDGESERWLMPRCVAAPDGRAWLTWLSVGLVRDDTLGIYDQQHAGLCAAIEDGAVRLLEDPGNARDSRFIADLREGLLATEFHNGHHGLRRNLQPCVWNGRLWLCWELRREHREDGTQQDQTHGLLVGRQWDGEAWSPPRLLHGGGICYALPAYTKDAAVPAWFIDFHGDDPHIPRVASIRPQDSAVYRPRGVEEWNRWTASTAPPVSPERDMVMLADGPVQLFWADTHCHSVFSADAEGEPDELAVFGRDTAGLDIMAIVDNDYYPCKTLTAAEWAVLHAMARHYTQDGRFILFPAYEYTYHRESLTARNGSDFNHRYVMYPVDGGPLVRRIDADGAVDRDLMHALRGTGAVPIAHHPAWELLDPELDRLVEVCSSWRICIEECDFIVRQLRDGVTFGFVGSSDSHRMMAGLGGALTGVFATELTSDAVIDAYRRRRLIATTGTRMCIDFRINGAFIGEDIRVESKPHLTGIVRAPRQIEDIHVIRDGDVVRRLVPAANEAAFDFTDDPPPGRHAYFVRVALSGDPAYNMGTEDRRNVRPFRQEGRYPGNWARADGCFGWTSPIWIER